MLLQLEASVRLLGLRKDVARLLSAADVFLLTSISEGIPLTIIEAMSAGVPVVSTRVGGVPEMIEEGRTGLLAPARDAPAVARQILRLSKDSELRAGIAEASRIQSGSLFCESAMHERYAAVYREMAHA